MRRDSANLAAAYQNLSLRDPAHPTHLITNPIIEIDEGLGKASVRSYYTVLQATTGLALQPIATGRYHDEFERIEQQWRFSYRDYSRLEFTGVTLSFHLRGFRVKPGGSQRLRGHRAWLIGQAVPLAF